MSARFEVYRERRTPARLVRRPAWRWRLIAANGEPVASSEAYGSERDAWRGVDDAARAVLAALPEAARRSDELEDQADATTYRPGVHDDQAPG
jgi:uncharacterized protein YegP (UPF0339 family)